VPGEPSYPHPLWVGEEITKTVLIVRYLTLPIKGDAVVAVVGSGLQIIPSLYQAAAWRVVLNAQNEQIESYKTLYR